MAHLTAGFRLLYSSGADFERKLEYAELLVGQLLQGSSWPAGAEEGTPTVPPLVCAHYLRSLVEWSCGALTKRDAAADGGGKKSKKGKAQAGGQAAEPQQQQPAKLQPRCWAVLTHVLSSSSISASQPLPAALLPAATAALHLVAEAQQQQQQQPAQPGANNSELLAQLVLLLQLLGGKFASSFRPGIEHAVSAAEAALAGLAAAKQCGGHQAWQPVAAAAVQLLAAAVGSHPNQRKVWDALVPRLLPLLAQAAFPASSSPGDAGKGASSSSGSSSHLQDCCRQLLESALLHQQHVAALAAAAGAEMAAALAETAGSGDGMAAAPAVAAPGGSDDSGGADGGSTEQQQKQQPGSSSAGGYVAQLFEALRQLAAASQLPLELLPWLSGCFCAALRQYRRAAETEAELTRQAGRRQQQQQGEEEGGKDAADKGTQGVRHRTVADSGSGGLSASADFHFWLALLRMLLPRMQQLEEQEGRGGGLAYTASGLAQMAAALRRHQLYRPTQDPAGHQRLLLQQLAGAALRLAQQDTALAAAALGTVQGVLAVEHRVIQQQLPLLWPLLLRPAADAPAAEAAPQGTASGVEAAVAAGLVAAFAELRQLEVLLLSLVHALSGAAAVDGDAARAVLRSVQFQAALAAAVRQLPSGQVPMLLRLAATAVAQLGGSGSSSSQLVVADLLCCCLDNLRVDLTTAVTAAAAAAAFVAALAPALLPALPAAAAPQAGGTDAGGGSSKKDKKRRKSSVPQGLRELLPALLRLYRRALAVHARCAALHPEVAPLAGQQVLPPASPSRPDCGPGTGYFAPLLQRQQHAAAGAGGSLPSLTELLQVSADSRNSGLRLALLQAAGQRVRVLHERLQFATHTCPITLLPEPGAEQQQQQEQQQEQERQERQRQQEAAELTAELRQLASAVVGAAAAESAPEAATDGNASSSMSALQLAIAALPLLQEWAAPDELQRLLRGCLHQAASSDGGGSTVQQRLCRQLLLADDLLEQRQLASLLPAAAAAEAQAALSAALRAGVEQGCADGKGSAEKKRRKDTQGRDEGELGGASASGSARSSTAALLEQLGRLARCKAPKGSSWTVAVEGCSASIVALAAPLGGSGGGSSGSSRKRKQQAAAALGSDVAAAPRGLAAVRRQAQLLAQLPLEHLQPQAAAHMAAGAVASLLGCAELGVAQLRAAGCEEDRRELAARILPAVSACLAVLARLASGSNAAPLGSQQQLLPGALQAALQAAACAASLAAAGSSSSGGSALAQLVAAAESGSRAVQAAVSAGIAAPDSSGVHQLAQQLGQQLSQQQGTQQWAAAVLVHGCLAACSAAVAKNSSSRGLADIWCGTPADTATEQHSGDAAVLIGSTAAQLEAAVAAALPAAAAAAAGGEAGSSLHQLLLASSLYRSAALLLRLRCSEHAAADALEQQRPSSSSDSIVGSMAASLPAAASVLEQLPAGQPAGQVAEEHPGQALEGRLLAPALLDYLAACCRVTGRMRPAASNSHYSSLLALLLRALARQQVGGASVSPPSRRIIPFAAAFPAAAAAVADAHAGGGSSAVRPLVLQALQELVAGSSSQQLLLPLRFVEAALPAAAAGSALALPLCELLLVLLEAAGGSRQQRLLGQHAERIASLLTAFISASAYASVQERQALRQQALPSLPHLAAVILAAGESGTAAAAAPAAAEHSRQQAGLQTEAAAPSAAEVAALCTAVRALESLAARPKLFPLPAVAASSMLSSLTALWSAYAEQQELTTAGAAPLPGFRFRLDVASGAGLFAGCCHLLLAMLRHRQQELRRCLPLVLQAVRALLRFLAAAELSARLQQHLPRAPPPSSTCRLPGEQAGERQWRVNCAEVLATVMSELAGLKEAGIGRYCPQLLADYLVLAAAPPSSRSKSLLCYASPAAAVAHGSDSSGAGDAVAAAAMAAAAAAEEDVLSGDPLSPDVAAALRWGASALYGACSAAEIQFLFASLGSGAGGGQRGGAVAAASWRAALAALKADYERHYKYTGKV